MAEDQVIEVEKIDEEEEKEEEGVFQYNYTPSYNRDTRKERRDTQFDGQNNNKEKEIDTDILNVDSDDTLITKAEQHQNYINAIASGTGNIDTKQRSNIFGIEYAPEELRGKAHWRNSAGDFLRMVDRAGIGFAQNLFNTGQDLGRMDMPAYFSEMLTGDYVSAMKIGLNATKEGLKSKSFREFFNELGFGKDSVNKMSLFDAAGGALGSGKINNFKMFDALTAEERMDGVDYGLFGLPSLTEMSGGYPERDTGRWFADGVTNFLGDGLPFFTIVAAAMSEPTPSAEVILAKKTLAKLKASSPQFRAFYNVVSNNILKGNAGTVTKKLLKFAAKHSIEGAGASAVAEAMVGNPYQDYGMDAILPDWLDYEKRADDSFFEAKIKSMIVSEFLLGPLFGMGIGGIGIGTKPIREPVINAFSSYFKEGNKDAFRNLMPDLMGGIQKKANQFRGPNRNKLRYNYHLQEFKKYVDNAEGDMVEGFVDYIFDTSVAKKITEKLGFTFDEIDKANLELNQIKAKDTEVTNVNVSDVQVEQDQKQIKELTKKVKELEENLEKEKNSFQKAFEKAAKSEDKLLEKVIINENIRPTQEINSQTKLGVGDGIKGKTPMQISSMRPDDIVIRPDVFQVKESGRANPRGVSGSLADETQYDPKFAGLISVWTDTSGELGQAGRVYVIDGHNRIDLAKRSNVEEVNVQMIRAQNVEDAKAEAAIININQLNFTQQGAIAPIDAAKVIKARGIRPLMEMGMNPRNKMVIQGLQLARLPDFMFTKLIGGQIGLEKALAYGSEKISPTAIGDVFKTIDKSNPSIDTIKEAIQMAREATESVPQEGDGFLPTMGAYFKSTNTQQLLKIRAQIRTQLRKKLTTLKNVGTIDKKTGVETVAGNKINLEGTQNAVLEASKAVDLFNAVAASGGETTQIIKELADQIKIKGNTPAKLVAQNLDRIQDAMQMEGSPLFKGSEVIEIAQEIDRQKVEIAEGMVDGSKKVPLNRDEIAEVQKTADFKKNFEPLELDQQGDILDQLQTKGKVTNNPSNIQGKALPPLVSNPKARVFPYLFEETMGIKPRDRVIAETLQKKETVAKLSNYELEDAVKRTEKYRLTSKQIKNIQAKTSKYEKANAIAEELDKQLMEMMEGKGVQGKLFKTDPDGKGEAAFEKLLDARDRAREEAAKFVDDRLELHNGHINAKNELENRKRSPEKYNEKEEEIAKEVKAEQKQKEEELKETIQYHKENSENERLGRYRTKKGYVLTEPHHIDNFTFATYGAQLEGMVDGKGGSYSKFYFGKPAPRYNNEVINFVNDLDIAIYTVAKQIANGTSRKSKSHYKYVDLLEDLGLTNNQIMTRYKEIIEDLKAGNFTIEPPEQYYSSKLLRIISELDEGMQDIAGRYEYNIDPEDIIAGRVNKAKKELDDKIYKEYQDINNPKKPDEFGAEQKDYMIEDEGGDLADDEVYFAFTDYARNQIVGLMQEIEKISGIDFKLVAEPITAVHGAKSSKQYGVPVGTKIQARGFYKSGQDPLKDLIVLSMIHGQDFASFSALSQTAYHEAFHRLFQRYFTKMEHRLLRSAESTLRQLAALTKPKMHDKIFGLNGKKKLGFEEIVAVAASGYKEARLIYEGKAGKWEKVLEKFSDMVTRTKNFLTGKGFRTWKDLFDDSFSGKIQARGMTPEGAKFRTSSIEETSFEMDGEELSNLFQDNLEALNDGTISIEQMMSNVRRPLINRKWQRSDVRTNYYIPTSNKNFIAANKTINQAMDKIFDSVTKPNPEFPELPSIQLEEITKLAGQLITDVDGNADEVLKIFAKAQTGDVIAQKDFVSFMAVKFLRDGNNDMFSLAAQNYSKNPTAKNAQLLVYTFEDAAKLNDAYSKWGRVTGQRFRLMGRDVRLGGQKIQINVMAPDTPIKMVGDAKSIDNAMEKGLKKTDQGLGDGAYFTSGTPSVDATTDSSLAGSLKTTDIIDLVDAGITVKEILREMKVNVNYKNTLNAYQKEAIEKFIRKHGVDGIRIRGVDVGMDNDIIYIPSIERANQVIGSKAQVIPEAQQPIGLNQETFENALAQGQNILQKVMNEEAYESIAAGKPNAEAKKILEALQMVNPYITDPEHGAKILRQLNKSLDELGSGGVRGEAVVDFFRNSIFLGIPTFTRVMIGTSFRARLVPLQKKIGAEVTARISGGLNNTEQTMAEVRSMLQGLNATLMADAQVFNAWYLARMAFKHDMNFGNIGKGQFDQTIAGSRKVKRFAVEEQTDLPLNYKPANRKITEQPKGDEWWLDPNSSTLKLFTHRVGSVLGNLSSRTFSALDTLISTGTVIAQENIRHCENILLDRFLQGIDISDPKVIHEAMKEAQELTRKSMIDVQMANGDVVKGGYFDSEYMRDTANYLAFTDDISVSKKKRTREYAERRAKEQGITDPMEMIEFIDNYLALDAPLTGRRQTKEANELLPRGAQERTPLGTFKYRNKVSSLQTSPTNLVSQGIRMGTSLVPPLGLVFPVNRTPLNIVKGLLRMLPVGNNFVDSYWRDINSEDLFTRENAIGEIVMGSMIISTGTALIGSGAIEVTGGYGFNPDRKQLMIDQRKPSWSIRFNKGNGNFSEWFSLEAFDTLGTLLSIPATYKDILETMPIEQFTSLDYTDALAITSDDKTAVDEKLQKIQDVQILVAAHVLRHLNAASGTIKSTITGQLDKNIFKPLNDINMLIREFGSNDANPINNIMKGKRSALGNFMSKKLQGFQPQFIRNFRTGMDNRRKVVPHSETPIWGFVENTWNGIMKDSPLFTHMYEVEIDEITGRPKTYALPFQYESIKSPLLRGAIAMLNPMTTFRPTIQKDFGIEGTIYSELNRLHGKGAYPRFIHRNFLSNAADGQLDDVEFNIVKKIFATEVKLDYHKIGKKMTFPEALYYLITQDNEYVLGRDIDPNRVSTSIAQGFNYPEKISTQRTLDKLKMIIDLANAYKKETKDIYIRKYLKSEKAQKLSLMELEDRNIAKADKDSLPIYGASVSLNEWREIINS